MSAAWMAGYVSDVTYTLGYYRELAPTFLDYVCLMSGVEGIKPGRKLRYCELGCGRGYGTTLLAAANPEIEFVGIDFNPAHIGEARTLAADAELDNMRFVEASFDDATRDGSLGEFDIVTIHGVYSWVDDSVRRDIVQFLRTRLAPGGIAYVSYNTLPGWSASGPMQHLLKEMADRGAGDSLARFQTARKAVGGMANAGAAYFAQNPGVKARLEAMDKQDVRYLAHEFLNAHWRPIYVTEALRDFAEAKLSYIGSASVTENRLKFAVPAGMIETVQAAPDLALREQLKDYAVNQQFRRDVYVKGPIRLTPAEFSKRWNRITFHRVTGTKEMPEKWKIPAGEARLKPGLAKALHEKLWRGPATGKQIMQAVTAAKFSEDEGRIAIELMVSNGVLTPGRPERSKVDSAATRRLNAVVMARTLTEDTHRFLATPATGSAIGTNFFERLVLPLVLKDGKADGPTIAAEVLKMMSESGRTLSREGRQLGPDDIVEIGSMVTNVRELGVPLWRQLGAID